MLITQLKKYEFFSKYCILLPIIKLGYESAIPVGIAVGPDRHFQVNSIIKLYLFLPIPTQNVISFYAWAKYLPISEIDSKFHVKRCL